MLIGHPDIAEVAIVGLPDAAHRRAGLRGDRHRGRSARPDCDRPARVPRRPRGVATFKSPEQVVVWDTLPKNDAGKILKHRIRARLVDSHE